MLIDLILQRALRCRGEQVLVTDCCASNYNGTLWAFIVYLVDELRWFEAVVLLYYMPRHSKGDADKFFGGHRRTWGVSEVISARGDAPLGRKLWIQRRQLWIQCRAAVKA